MKFSDIKSKITDGWWNFTPNGDDKTISVTSLENPNIVYIIDSNNKKSHNAHYVNGEIHNDNGPAEFYNSGSALHCFWHQNGKWHRDNDEPAYIKTDKGIITRKTWVVHGKPCRVNNLPHSETYEMNNDEDIVMEHIWWNNSFKKHRENGKPAVIGYIDNNKVYEHWHNHGKFHRDDGPAIIAASIEDWYVNGTKITKDLKKWIKENNFPSYEEWTDEIKVMFKLRFL